MGALALALLLQDPLVDLLRRLRDDDPAARDAAAASILERWSAWSAAELDALRAAGSDPDVEVATRAKLASDRVGIRRLLGAEAVAELPGADLALARGGPEGRLGTLKDLSILVQVGRAPEAALRSIAGLAAERRWALPTIELLLLAKPAPRPFAPLLAAAAADPDPNISLGAIDLLERTLAYEHFGALVPKLEDPDRAAWAAAALGQTAARAHADLVAARLGASPLWAARVLGGMGAAEHAGKVAALLERGDAESARVAAEALGRMAAAEHAPALLRLLKHEDAGVRAEAATALGRMKAGARELVPLLLDREGRVQAAAAAALGAAGDASVAPALAALLAERDTSRLGFAVEALGRLRARGRAESVAALLAHPQPWTRSQAARALARMGDTTRVEALVEMLGDEWDLPRTMAAVALGELSEREWPAGLKERAARRLRATATSDERADTRLAAAAAALLLDGSDAVLEKRLLDDPAAESEDGPTALLRALARVHEREGWAKLDREIELDAPAGSAEALAAAVARAGLKLELSEDARVLGRAPAGRTTPRKLLEHFFDEALPHVEGERLRVLALPEAVAAWRAYPRKR